MAVSIRAIDRSAVFNRADRTVSPEDELLVRSTQLIAGP